MCFPGLTSIQHGILVFTQAVAIESYCFFLLPNSILLYKNITSVYLYMVEIPGVSRQVLPSSFKEVDYVFYFPGLLYQSLKFPFVVSFCFSLFSRFSWQPKKVLEFCELWVLLLSSSVDVGAFDGVSWVFAESELGILYPNERSLSWVSSFLRIS